MGRDRGCDAGAVLGAAVVFVDAFGVERIGAIFLNVSTGADGVRDVRRRCHRGAMIIVVIPPSRGRRRGRTVGLPDAIRKPVGAAVGSVLAMGFLQRIVPISLDQLGVERDWLYSQRAAASRGLGAVVAPLRPRPVDREGAQGSRDPRAAAGGPPACRADGREEGRPRDAVADGRSRSGCSCSRAVPYIVGSVVSEVLGTVMVFALLGLGLNIVVGYAGLLDLGYVAFFAFGAYATALLTGATLNTFTGSGRPGDRGEPELLRRDPHRRSRSRHAPGC